jgi:hypothetical protein
MDIIELLASGALNVPWPTRAGADRVGSGMPEPSDCSACATLECIARSGSILGQTCSFGLTYYSALVRNYPITVYGLTGLSDREALGKRLGRTRRDELKGRGIRQVDIHRWFEGLRKVDKLLQTSIDRELGDKLEALHETPKIAEKIRLAAEQIIYSKRGATLEDKFEASTTQERIIYKASEVLVDTFDLLTVFINPNSASLGLPSGIEPFKLIHKLIVLLNGEPFRRVIFNGECRRRYDLLDSFKILPMTILNNAFKYSLGSQPVEISFTDLPSHTRISITNTGPLIDQDDLPLIFDRRFRGDNARRMNSEGMGIGLYVAQQAARANGTVVEVESLSLGSLLNGLPLARNTFRFDVRDVASRRTRSPSR